VIGSFLTAAGHEVLLAVGGREAVQIASEQSLDLVLMDVRMPEMDGLEATRLIRALPHERGRVPILALTAYTFVYQVAQCREAGMDGHVTKPVNYTALVRAIDAAVARSPQKWPTEGEAEPIADEALPLLDREVLDDTLAFLPSGDAMSSLRSLQGCMQRMLRLLEQRAATPLLLDAAHTLASTAGMFGFSALSATMRHFETVTAEGAPEAEALAHRLPDELLASLAALNAVACEDRTQPTTVTA
jgi:CheY-like chemotaxis protein/HPt (histidine-containing phosphotransfer) domain-containing protein